MTKTITVSAPGKLMLFGEHAVVYNHPCLVTAVDQRMRVTAEIIDTPEFHLEAPDVKVMGYKKIFSELGKGDIPKGAQFVEIAVKNLLQRHPAPNAGSTGLKITTTSEFSSQFGFGSSSASTVCTIKAISELLELNLSQKEIFDLAFKTVLDIQGKGSGFDVAAAVYGGTLYFVTGGTVIEPLQITDLPLIVGYSGVKADTVTLINAVKATSDKYPEIIEGIYQNIETLVERAKVAILASKWQTVGELLHINQGYLDALGVSTRKLADMIYAANDAGAYGTKLSGAGGGDCIIGLAPEEKRKTVEEAIQQAGGEIVSVKTNAEGVRLEK
ncbi:MAG TPA: mevalonate kinase [Candidatus Saccharimonadales bacterium]|nr:mevalonate kinase [Candidatus Saccharimonadales bacterium]